MVWGRTLRKESHARNLELKKCTHTLFLDYSWPLLIDVRVVGFHYIRFITYKYKIEYRRTPILCHGLRRCVNEIIKRSQVIN